jgi:hypothetical protein
MPHIGIAANRAVKVGSWRVDVCKNGYFHRVRFISSQLPVSSFHVYILPLFG